MTFLNTTVALADTVMDLTVDRDSGGITAPLDDSIARLRALSGESVRTTRKRLLSRTGYAHPTLLCPDYSADAMLPHA